jgi:hypothetical protein
MSLATADLPADPDALRAFALACQAELKAAELSVSEAERSSRRHDNRSEEPPPRKVGDVAAKLNPGLCSSSIEKSQFLPDRNVTPAADNFFTTRHHDLALGKCGGVKGRSRRQPVRAAQPLRPSPLPNTLEMPCDRPACDQRVRGASAPRDARPFEGSPGASRLLGGRCRATCPR